MIKDMEFYKKKAHKMLDDDQERNEAFEAYEDMYHCDWDLPSLIENIQWVRKVISTDPHDAIAAGNRVLSALDPKIRLQPLADNQDTKALANSWEKVLLWQLKSLNRRRQGGIVSDIVYSSLMYDEICAQVIDLDYQIPQMELLKGETTRMKAARRYGRFAVNVYNPRQVHVRYSGIMPECVLLNQEKYGFDILAEWGENASEVEGHEDEIFDYFDFMDYDNRAVWILPREGGVEATIIEPMEHGLPFLPWVVMVGSATFEDMPENKRQPILYSVYRSGNWETQNVVKSLYTSEVIAHAAAPRIVEEGTNPDEADINYQDPTRPAKAPPGNTLKPFPPPPIDQALLTIDAGLANSTNKSTVASILQNADIPPGTAYATLNLQTQTAVGALKPAKKLAELALAEVFTNMLLWVEDSGKALYGLGADRRGNYGKQYIIEPDLISPGDIYIEVELEPDVPTDRQQRVNTASIAVRELNYPREYALEDIGVTDPQAAEEARYAEIMGDSLIQLEIQGMTQQQQLQMQMQQLQMQMEAQQAQMQMQAQQMAAMQGGGMPQQGPTPEQIQATQVQQFPGGMGFNPAAGGAPPAEAFPGGTREGVTGRTRRGEETGAF